MDLVYLIVGNRTFLEIKDSHRLELSIFLQVQVNQ